MKDTSDSSVFVASGSSAGKNFMSKTSSAATGAAKVFREFKWGLLTLFLLMVVVISLIYDGGRNKPGQQVEATKSPSVQKQAGVDPAHEVGFRAPSQELNTALQPPHNGRVDDYDPVETRVPPRDPGRLAGSGGTAGRSTSPHSNNLGSDIGRQPRGANERFPSYPSQPPVLPRIDNRRLPEWQIGQSSTTAQRLKGERTAVAGVNQISPNDGSERLQPRVDGGNVTDLRTQPALTASDGAVTRHQVQAGETLSGIAQKYYPGNAWKGTSVLLEANKNLFDDPRKMRSGMTITIPTLKEVSPSTGGAATSTTQLRASEVHDSDTIPADASAPSPNSKAHLSAIYTVEEGDTLQRIASKVLNDSDRWPDIHKWNEDEIRDPSFLRVGQRLKIEGSKVNVSQVESGIRQDKKRMAMNGNSGKKAIRTEQSESLNSEPVWMP